MSSLYEHGSSRESIDRRIARLAARQYGVVSRDDALRLGATRAVIDWRLATGRWERIALGIYRVAGSPASWQQSLLVACLSWGAGAVASHRGAAPLFVLPGFERNIVELTVPRNRWRKHPGAIIHRLDLPAIDRTMVNGIPVTTPVRTLIDIAAVSSRELVEEALDDALRRKLVSVSRLRRRLAEVARRGRPGIGVIRALLDARDSSVGTPASVFETRLLRLIQRAGLPRPAVQHEVRDRGRVIAIVDLAYPEAKLAVEADGYRWHSSRARWQRDLARRNALSSLGWSVLHVTWDRMTKSPSDVIDELRSRLGT